MADLDTDIRYIKGIGEARGKKMEKLKIFRLRDLVTFFPRGYEDRTVFKKINELEPGETVCVKALAAENPTLSFIRRGMEIVKLRVVDDAATMNVTFFNQSYMKENIKQGEEYCFYGKIGGSKRRPEMINPVVEKENTLQKATGRIMPVYHLTAGISQGMMVRAVQQGLLACGDILPDPLPMHIQEEYKLAKARYAYDKIHFPDSFEALELARKRLIFEELFVFSCLMRYLKGGREERAGISVCGENVDKFISQMPFELTGAQKRAVYSIKNDLESPIAMQRLVQGDVGSGKTVVAAAGCFLACTAGYQAAVMAPTEILAEQHYKTFGEMLTPFGIKVEKLLGSNTAAEKREIKKKLKSGDIDVVVGTHAIISEDVEFKKLAFAVTDEQHRFGVEQRAALMAKGESANVLVMSATPIPRTLALIIYGDLDVSIIDEMPPGRRPVETFSVDEKKRERVYAFVRRLVSEGRQAYIVCPMVEESDGVSDELKAVTKYAAELRQNVFPDLQLDFVHGKMKSKEKEKIMRLFASGKIDILVSTTVIEVGVDVPNAAVIVIENADRFGLSQLHQLRGRVGRGAHQSYCIMFEGAGGETAKRRLDALCRTNDGFAISEEDLKLRGPGDFFGSRQHGLPEMKIANFTQDMDVLTSAKKASDEVMANDPMLEMPENQRLRRYMDDMMEKCTETFN